jgi:hypothetical protein
MPKKTYSIDTQPGIQRDGTYFDKNYYTDGQWVRFQRGRPRKIGGYRAITTNSDGISRGIYVNSEDGLNRIYNGYESGLQITDIDNNGIGAGVSGVTFGGPILTTNNLVGGSSYTNGTYTNVPLTGGSGSGAQALVVVSTNTVTSVTITAGGQYYAVGDTLSAASSSIGGTGSGFSVKVATVDSQFASNQNNLWQFDALFDSQGELATLLLAHPGQNLAQTDSIVNTAVLAGRVDGSLVQPLKDVNGPTPTGDIISVSGGVVVLHPYTFVYGNNGLIKNSSAGDPYNWNSPDANETNVSATKIVKGLPVRGGSNSPSGLFWALDSLIRVSLAPQTLGVPGSADYAPTTYWRYDIISSQSSILSSQSVIEYDGIYYWCGVDRFLMYNGVVREVPNSFNQNYFFDNLNYDQRQKVWATKVPRYGEIWWFYPAGNSQECNNAIIYNVRENIWYDAGMAPGAQRSAGYFSQVFRFPINAGTDLSVSSVVFTASITTTSGSPTVTMTTSNQMGLSQIVAATGVPSGAYITAIKPGTTPGTTDLVLSVNASASGTVTATFSTPSGKISLWQHETGVDDIRNAEFFAIESFFETSDIGWVGGGPSQSPASLPPQGPQGGIGENRWLHLERVEPDFVQSGRMEFYVLGRPYAQSEDQTSGPYHFEPNTNKIDLREQRREMRLKFRSNVVGGDYQMGRVLLLADVGDVRGY